jgi:hypothetical protein
VFLQDGFNAASSATTVTFWWNCRTEAGTIGSMGQKMCVQDIRLLDTQCKPAKFYELS